MGLAPQLGTCGGARLPTVREEKLIETQKCKREDDLAR
jgi:hypothetical protein